MLTIFSTPKPFLNHEAVIQRNAIKSWTLLHPDVEVILLGDEAGAREVAAELNIRHEPTVLRNQHGTKFLNYLFDRAQEIARNDLMCYVNCDIILTTDFVDAMRRVSQWNKSFLMVGRRWDIDIKEPWHFDRTDWQDHIRGLVAGRGNQRDSTWIDYFAFSRGLYRNIPPFVIGRVRWDHWLVGHARSLGVPVVDASSGVMAIHQNHDYAYHPDGKQGVWQGEEAKRNFELAGGSKNLYTIADATHKLRKKAIKRNPWSLFRISFRWARAKRVYPRRVRGLVLGSTRGIRHLLGLRMSNLERLKARLAEKR